MYQVDIVENKNALSVLLSFPKSFANYMESLLSTGLMFFSHQETSGSVLVATNGAVDVSKQLLVEDFTKGIWATAGTGSIDDLDSFTTTGAGGVRVNDPSITSSKTYTARAKGTTTSSIVRVFNFAGTTEYKTITGSGAFDEPFTFTGVGDGIYFRNEDAGTTDIDWTVTHTKQTNILELSAYPGDELLDESGDGTGDKDNYIGTNDAVLTNPSPNLLRVERDGTNNPGAFQTALTIGQRVVATEEVRTDGNATATGIVGGVTVLSGVSNTDFVSHSDELVPTNTNVLWRSVTGVDTEYTEWRNLSIKPANPLNGDIVSTTIGQPGWGNIPLAHLADGSNDVNQILSAELNSGWYNPSTGTLFIFAEPKTMTAGRVLTRLTVDADNWIELIVKDANTITANYRSAGTDYEVDLAAAVDTPAMYSMTWAGGIANGYRNSVAGTPVGSVPVIIGNLTVATIFSSSDAAANPFHTEGAYWGLAPVEYTQTQIAAISERSGV